MTVGHASSGSAHDLAGELDRFAAEVLALRGVSRINPHVFVEDKSELAGRMIQRATELRTGLQGQHPRTGAQA